MINKFFKCDHIFLSDPKTIVQSIKTEDPMATEEEFVWRLDLSESQCSLFLINSNTLAFNLDGLVLSSSLLNGWTYLIDMFASLTLVPVSTSPYFKYHVL